MASKAPADGSAHINYILSALSHADTDLKVDWAKVAIDNEIGYARNAATKFKDTIKKYGYKYESNIVTKIGSIVPATPTTVTAKAKKASTTAGTIVKKQAKGVTKPRAVKKRKLDSKDSLHGSDDEAIKDEDDGANARVKAENEDDNASEDDTKDALVNQEDESVGNDESDEVVD